MRPIIGITPEAVTVDRADGCGGFCGVSYSAAIEAAGGLPLVLPLTRDVETLDACLQCCHGLLLSGGGDLSEQYYAPKLEPAARALLRDTDAVRDEMEIYLVREALDADRPLLGICRGIQILNLAAGGSVLPDIQIRHPHALRHDGHPPTALVHPLDWQADSRLGRILAGAAEQVNSTHHQAIATAAPGLDVVARAPDGIIEAVERPGARFCAAVQFHPERLLGVVPQMLRLFEAFVAACR